MLYLVSLLQSHVCRITAC